LSDSWRLTAAHVAAALHAYRQVRRKNDPGCPDGVAMLEAIASKIAESSQSSPSVDRHLEALIAAAHDQSDGQYLLSVQQVAARLGCSRKIVDRAIARGDLGTV